MGCLVFRCCDHNLDKHFDCEFSVVEPLFLRLTRHRLILILPSLLPAGLLPVLGLMLPPRQLLRQQ